MSHTRIDFGLGRRVRAMSTHGSELIIVFSTPTSGFAEIHDLSTDGIEPAHLPHHISDVAAATFVTHQADPLCATIGTEPSRPMIKLNGITDGVELCQLRAPAVVGVAPFQLTSSTSMLCVVGAVFGSAAIFQVHANPNATVRMLLVATVAAASSRGGGCTSALLTPFHVLLGHKNGTLLTCALGSGRAGGRAHEIEPEEPIGPDSALNTSGMTADSAVEASPLVSADEDATRLSTFPTPPPTPPLTPPPSPPASPPLSWPSPPSPLSAPPPEAVSEASTYAPDNATDATDLQQSRDRANANGGAVDSGAADTDSGAAGPADSRHDAIGATGAIGALGAADSDGDAAATAGEDKVDAATLAAHDTADGEAKGESRGSAYARALIPAVLDDSSEGEERDGGGSVAHAHEAETVDASRGQDGAKSEGIGVGRAEEDEAGWTQPARLLLGTTARLFGSPQAPSRLPEAQSVASTSENAEEATEPKLPSAEETPNTAVTALLALRHRQMASRRRVEKIDSGSASSPLLDSDVLALCADGTLMLLTLDGELAVTVRCTHLLCPIAPVVLVSVPDRAASPADPRVDGSAAETLAEQVTATALIAVDSKGALCRIPLAATFAETDASREAPKGARREAPGSEPRSRGARDGRGTVAGRGGRGGTRIGESDPCTEGGRSSISLCTDLTMLLRSAPVAGADVACWFAGAKSETGCLLLSTSEVLQVIHLHAAPQAARPPACPSSAAVVTSPAAKIAPAPMAPPSAAWGVRRPGATPLASGRQPSTFRSAPNSATRAAGSASGSGGDSSWGESRSWGPSGVAGHGPGAVNSVPLGKPVVGAGDRAAGSSISSRPARGI